MAARHIILGATGHVGSALAEALLGRGEPVTVVIHDPTATADWQQRGAQVAVADVHDVPTMHKLFRQGQRLFLLNPPADPATDTVAEERRSLHAILAALENSGLEKIVAESTYGAQPAERAGDLGVLYELEQALARQPVSASIIRAAYYMSNWDAALATARQQGVVHTLYPTDFRLPMVAPHDIGQVAARLMTEPATSTGLHYVEGPARYTSADVAATFAAALHRPVVAQTTPRAQWPQALCQLGFSNKAAQSFINMTALTLAGDPTPPAMPVRGTTSLQQYVQKVVAENRMEPSS